MRRFRLLLPILTIVALLVGCSRTDLLYSVAETVVKSRATDYLLLDGREKAFVTGTIDRGFADMRVRMLPKVAAQMRAWADRIEMGGVSRGAEVRFVHEGRALVEEVIVFAAPYTAEILVRHRSPEKRAYLKERMAEKLADKLEEEQEPRTDRMDAWTDRTVTNFERFSGDLTDDQKAIVEGFAGPAVDDHAAWLENRAERQQALIDFLATQPTQAEIEAMIPTLLLRAHEVVDPAYKTVSDRRWARVGQMVGAVLRSMDEAQRTSLVDSLRSYADDFEGMAQG